MLSIYALATGPSEETTWLRLPSTLHFGAKHPIDSLIQSGQLVHQRVHQKAYQNTNVAAKAYRERRGRHPPPKFDEWVDYALKTNSPLREEFFDQIYEDLEPFWALNPFVIRRMAKSWDSFISLRNGHVALQNASMEFNWERNSLWLEALKQISDRLPDVDMPLNERDQPRIIVPWEEMNGHIQIALATRHVRTPTPENPMLNQYSTHDVPNPPAKDAYNWANNETYWHKARNACHPESRTRQPDSELDLPQGLPDFEELEVSKYVTNYTSSRLVCDHSYISKFHGSFVHAMEDSTYKKLFPMFSATKIAGVNNDILLPHANYFKADLLLPGGTGTALEVSWADKKNMAVWRGSPADGKPDGSNWKYLHRQRLVSMMNSSSVQASERLRYPGLESLSEETRLAYESRTALNFPLPDFQTYALAAIATTPTTLGEWSKRIANASFTDLLCHDGSACEYLYPYYRISDPLAMDEMFKYKFLPDVDGTSHSGRFRSYLQSTSMPIKATIWAEWHDARLIPWFHFVPMDNTMKDWWGIMEYFVGYNPAELFENDGGRTMPDKRLFRPAHDKQAKTIAYQGMEWSRQALRQEDMILYMYRLILEYARICDSKRESMGWTEDLVQ